MTDASEPKDVQPAEYLEDSLEELLGDAVVYAPGEAPPGPAAAPVLDLLTDRPAYPAVTAAESRISPVYWAAAVVWNLPGGLGGWWLLRKSHPRVARRLLLVGIVSFAVTAAVLIALVIADHSINPRDIYLAK